MGWRWKEPAKMSRPRSLGGFATRRDAEISAVYNSSFHRVEDDTIRAGLVRSLIAAGWSIEPELGGADG